MGGERHARIGKKWVTCDGIMKPGDDWSYLWGRFGVEEEGSARGGPESRDYVLRPDAPFQVGNAL